MGGPSSGALSLLLQKIQSSTGYKPEYQVFVSLLKSCAALPGLKLGKALHSHVVKLGHDSCVFLSKGLLNMYAKSNALDDSQKLFGLLGYRDAVIWNILLSGFGGSRMHDIEVMRLFYAMHIQEDPKPNSVTLAIVLPVCARLSRRGLLAGKSLHAYAFKSGLESHTLVGNALLSMYAKTGHAHDDAFAVFDRIPEKDVVSWNAMIAGLSENKFLDDAFTMFCLMLKGPTQPNYATIVNILPVCAVLEEDAAYYYGQEIHCFVLRRTELLDDVSVTNALVSFYSRIGQMKEAETLFRRMKFRDMVSWNSIISGYASNDEWLKALELFRGFVSLEMFVPDSVTLLSILPVCVNLRNLRVGKQIHGYVIRNPILLGDTAVGNALISVYSNCNDIKVAYQAFLFMSKRDLISWNTMLDAFAENQLETCFVNQLRSMFREGMTPDSITILITVRLYGNVYRVDKIKEAHGFSLRSGLLTANIEPTLGNSLIDAYAKCGKMEYASIFFESLSGGRNVVTCNSIISGYVNHGLHDDANLIFERMNERDLTTWNLMVRVYSENGCPSQALNLFHELQHNGIKPDAVSIMSILPVCANLASTNLLKQCHGYVLRAQFEDVQLEGALLDVYSKCGSVDLAYKLFKSTPEKDLVMFTAMVGGYAMHGMAEEAIRLFLDMIELGLKPDHVMVTAVLSACSHSGLVEEGLRIFHSIDKVHGIEPAMEQYACVVDLLSRGGRIKDAYALVSRMPTEANGTVWGALLGACRTHQEVEIGRVAASRLFEIEKGNIGSYVVMSNLYAANDRWDGVLEMRKLMRTRDLQKPAGCSWIEVDGSNNVFIAGDSSHPQRSIIYNTLCILDQQIKDSFWF